MHIATNSKMFSMRNSYVDKRRQSLQHLFCLQHNLECIPKTMNQDKCKYTSITLQESTNSYTAKILRLVPFMQALLFLEIIHHFLYEIQSNSIPFYSCSWILWLDIYYRNKKPKYFHVHEWNQMLQGNTK